MSSGEGWCAGGKWERVQVGAGWREQAGLPFPLVAEKQGVKIVVDTSSLQRGAVRVSVELLGFGPGDSAKQEQLALLKQVLHAANSVVEVGVNLVEVYHGLGSQDLLERSFAWSSLSSPQWFFGVALASSTLLPFLSCMCVRVPTWLRAQLLGTLSKGRRRLANTHADTPSTHTCSCSHTFADTHARPHTHEHTHTRPLPPPPHTHTQTRMAR